jgi:hypothetical protein
MINDSARILVVGLARNIEKTIHEEIKRIETLATVNQNLKYFIVESDSEDNTVKAMNIIKLENERFDFISMGNLQKVLPKRLARLSYCRNIYIDYIRKNQAKENWNVVVVMDFDGVNKKLSSPSFQEALNYECAWDVLTCNQNGPYYDIYALRSKGWVEDDYLNSISAASQRIADEVKDIKGGRAIQKIISKYKINRLKSEFIYKKMRFIPSWTRPIEVDSAFGGMAIYKTNTLMVNDYQGSGAEVCECEHVVLHRKIHNQGGKIFIFPPLIAGGWNEHSLNKIYLIRIARRIKAFWRKVRSSG